MSELQEKNHRILVAAVGGYHAHLLVELPDDPAQVKLIIGRCKSKSSHTIRDLLPGRVWAHGGKFDRVEDEEHHTNVYFYILDHIDEGAFAWSFRDESRLGPDYQQLWE